MVNEPVAEGEGAQGAEAAGLAQMLGDNPEFANALGDDDMGEDGAGSLMPLDDILPIWSRAGCLSHQAWHDSDVFEHECHAPSVQTTRACLELRHGLCRRPKHPSHGGGGCVH